MLLSLVFLILLSFVMGILQVSEIQRSKSLSRLAADRAVYSIFGEYHQGLLEKYHVFAVDGSYGTGMYEEDNLIRRMHYYGTEGMDHEIAAVQYLTDNSAQAFREQVLEYMEQRYGMSLIRNFTGMTARWEEQKIQGDGMNEEQENVKSQIKSLREQGKDTEELTESGENPFTCMEQIEKKGLTALVMPEEMKLSGNVIDLDVQASYRSLRKGRGTFPARAGMDGPEERLLFNEYLLKMFENAGMKAEHGQSKQDAGAEEENRSLKYEVEYILAGKASDKENLESVLMRIFLIRMALNYGYLIKDSAKQREADMIALAVSALLMIPEASEAVKQAVLTVWAAGESVMDLRALLSGRRAALVKTSENWQLTASALFRIGSDKEKQNGIDAEGGLSYEDYLRMLLFLANPEDTAMRAVDRTEENLSSVEQGRRFYADQCITRLEIENTVGLYGSLFYKFPVSFGYQ